MGLAGTQKLCSKLLKCASVALVAHPPPTFNTGLANRRVARKAVMCDMPCQPLLVRSDKSGPSVVTDPQIQRDKKGKAIGVSRRSLSLIASLRAAGTSNIHDSVSLLFLGGSMYATKRTLRPNQEPLARRSTSDGEFPGPLSSKYGCHGCRGVRSVDRLTQYTTNHTFMIYRGDRSSYLNSMISNQRR